MIQKKGNPIQKISPYLWFDNQSEEAVNFYLSVFKDSKVGTIARYSPGQEPEKPGRVTQAMLQMKKIDIAGLQRAYEGE